MKNVMRILTIIIMIIVVACKKEKLTYGQPSVRYTSLDEFYNKHEVKRQIFNVSALTGGTFTSSNGTIVTIPANAFVTSSGSNVTGNVTVEFKDVYKKSDMLLSNIPSVLTNGKPLKSAGEFFIRVLSGNVPVTLVPGKKITVEQPLEKSGGELDLGMTAFVQPVDSDFTGGWEPTIEDSITWSTSSYIYNWYQTTSYNEGTWLNTDNSFFFEAYQQTNLALTINNASDYSIGYTYIDVYLVFEDVNCVVKMDRNFITNNFEYNHSPIGLKATLVAISAKDGNLHAAFAPVVISANQTISISLSQMNENTFLNQLNALN